MQLKDVGVQVATRELQASGRKITVVIGKPEMFPDGVNFYCPYQIVGIGNERVRYAGGVDAVQALQLAMQMIGAELYTSREAQSRQLSWIDDTGNLGFPVPDVLQDLVPPG